MAQNPYVNEVKFGNQTVLSLKEDDVTPDDVLQGKNFHDRSGAPQTGSLVTHNIVPTPSASVNESAVVTAVNAGLLEGGENDDVPSLYGIGKWSNTMTKTYYVQGIAGDSTPIGRSGIGNWCVDGSDETGWIYIPELVGIGNLNHKINITYDPSKSGQILKGGWIVDDVTGKMAIKFANRISEADTHTACIGIEITIKRTEHNPVS